MIDRTPSREAFERFITDNFGHLTAPGGHHIARTRDVESHGYFDERVSMAWKAWQEANTTEGGEL